MSQHSQFASHEIERLLTANGLCDLEAAFELGEPLDVLHAARATRHQHKRVVRLDLNSPTGKTRVYIKRQWRRERWLPRPTDIRHRIALKCSPVHEWHGLRILKSAGFHVSEPLALFWQGWGFSRGAVVTRAVPPTRSMADLLLRGELQRMETRRLDTLIEAAAGVVARLHRARLSWRSMKAKHFYPEEVPGGKWRIWLIDCEGVYRRASRHDCRREWRNYLEYIQARAPGLQKSFVTAYGAAANL